MKVDEACVVLCRKEYKKPEMSKFKQMIDQEYRVHWLLDALPVAVRNDELGYVTRGYPVGFTTLAGSKTRHFLYNHVRIIVRYTENPAEYEGSRIVGFEVVPFSIKVDIALTLLSCSNNILYLHPLLDSTSMMTHLIKLILF
jgi:transmembrane 9 superfamily member 2/4